MVASTTFHHSLMLCGDCHAVMFAWCCLQVAGYSGLLLAAPTVLYEIIAYVVPGLTKSERKFLAPIVFGSSILFYAG
jgi:sec-independent protein translocase protein TatC